MNTLIKHIFLNGWEASAGGETGDASGNRKLIVNVIATDAKGTLAALSSARTLARDLGACIRVLAAHAVPFAYSLDKPPVAVAFIEKFLADLVSGETQETTEVTIHLYLCRDRLDTLGQVMEPNSFVVIGGKHWWPNDSRWIARMLRSIGHRVILVPNLPAHVRKHQLAQDECSAKSRA